MSDDPQLIDCFKNACSIFDINAIDSHQALCDSLDTLAGDLGKDKQARIQLGAADVWADISKLWQGLVHAQLTFWDGDDSDDGEDGGSTASAKEKRKQHSLCALCISLARFTRNLVAGVPANQVKAFENEPIIRRLLHYYTSWSSLQDEEGKACVSFRITLTDISSENIATFAARILTQMLSNIITGNETLISSLWETYLNLQEDQVVLIRLLASPDSRILLAVMTMITSCLHESRSRTKLLTRAAIGARICVALLDNMVKLYDADEASDGARAFDVGYSIFARIIECGLMSDLYVKLAMPEEIVTPHQTTLLKLLDSYLQSASASSPGTRSRITKTHSRLCSMLSNLFFSLSSFAQMAIRRFLRPVPSGHNSDELASPAELDVFLPKVCEALVLVTQCIITITLAAQGPQSQFHGASALTGSPSASAQENAHVFFNQARFEGISLAESLVEILRLLDRFIPRINFRKPVVGAGNAVQPTDKTESPAPHSTAIPGSDSPGFNFLKRDLVRLLGILCNEDKAVQDRLRKCGGIEVVMNLCVIDKRNPYLREHAIFTLHNLLKDNLANQAVVEEIKPMGRWDEDGILRDTPGAVRK
ncbi:hypothetical protein GYMLUDRAFT_243286 [Collybiopsis luxurians FD-317 M1]|uniref:Ataxin-10 homolog n=1 Tax=Collybiopsis luxurians FD-317 M1 TaxID=944289 RepID=A0A0D0BD45_9AGAR|nr:hypothetical protein GYMLUDRAFT_243286 [Collybiopsis luxurians FD-317 M1]